MTPNRLRTSSPGRSSGAYSYVRQGAVLGAAKRPVSGKVAKEVDGRNERGSGPVTDRGLVERSVALSDAVTESLAARRHAGALALIQELVMIDPCEPRWHQKYGEVLRTLGRKAEAAAAYRLAARHFEALALHARAGAALRVAESLEATSSEAVTVPLGPATTDRQRQHSQTDPAAAAPRQESRAGLAEEDVAAGAVHEESFAGLLDEDHA